MFLSISKYKLPTFFDSYNMYNIIIHAIYWFCCNSVLPQSTRSPPMLKSVLLTHRTHRIEVDAEAFSALVVEPPVVLVDNGMGALSVAILHKVVGVIHFGNLADGEVANR